MMLRNLLASAVMSAAGPIASESRSAVIVSQGETEANRARVEGAFVAWQAGRGSLYDLIADGGSVTIAGQSVHSGIFSKADFLRDRAQPFAARFSTPILPTSWRVWAVDDQVFVRWDSRAMACDGKAYNNSYAYFISMKDGRAITLTMFLDMGAFDDVWNRCQPAKPNEENK